MAQRASKACSDDSGRDRLDDVAALGIAGEQPIGHQLGHRVVDRRRQHVQLLGERADVERVVQGERPVQDPAAEIGVDDPVLFDLEPTELATEVGQRRTLPCHGPCDVREEDAVRPGQDVLSDPAFAVRQRVGEQRHAVLPAPHLEALELLAERRRETFGDDALILVQDVHPERTTAVDRLLGAAPGVQAHQEHRRLERQRRDRAGRRTEVVVPVSAGQDRHPTREVADDVPEGLLVGHVPRPLGDPTGRWSITTWSRPSDGGRSCIKRAFRSTDFRDSWSRTRPRRRRRRCPRRVSVRREEPLCPFHDLADRGRSSPDGPVVEGPRRTARRTSRRHP